MKDMYSRHLKRARRGLCNFSGDNFHLKINEYYNTVQYSLGKIFLFTVENSRRSSRCTTSVVDTVGKWKKSSIRILIIFCEAFGY